MGTSLTGTKPKDTYDSLIKVGDNGPISGTAKYLSDGLGNDLPIAVSTSNVGIGTSTPTSGGVSSTLRVKQTSDASSGFTGLGIETAAATGELLYFGHTGTTATIGQTYLGAGAYQPIAFSVGGSERFRVTANGVTFNGDTAAANALDDYEEGTFTPTFNGTTRTGGTLTARYTKIGRLVHYDIFLFGATFSGSSGPASIGGFPFTSNVLVYGQGLISYNNCVDGNTNGGYVDAGGTTFFPVDENNTTVASFIDGTADRNLMISGSYTV